MPSQLLQGLGVGFSGPDSSQSIALVNLILSGVVVVLLIMALPWRRLRWPVPMPWKHGRMQCRMQPECLYLQNATLEAWTAVRDIFRRA